MLNSVTLTDSIPAELISSCLGVGNDLVFVPDFTLLLNPLFIARVYTDGEIRYCSAFQDAALRYASTWAAKEAVYKALKQTGSWPKGFKKIEIFRLSSAGKPSVILAPEYADCKIALSITHDGDYAWAIACVTRSKEPPTDSLPPNDRPVF